jgi:hypothetical protein
MSAAIGPDKNGCPAKKNIGENLGHAAASWDDERA